MQEFWVCGGCGKVYWQGSHWSRSQWGRSKGVPRGAEAGGVDTAR